MESDKHFPFKQLNEQYKACCYNLNKNIWELCQVKSLSSHSRVHQNWADILHLGRFGHGPTCILPGVNVHTEQWTL